MRTMETAVLGNLPCFSITYGDFSSFIDRLEQYFSINKLIDDDKQKALLLLSMDEESYKVVRDLVFPQIPNDKTYKELVDIVRQKSSDRKSIWHYRIEFNNAKQEENETISEWIARVRRYAVDCKLSYEIDLFLIHRFIAGIRDPEVQKRLCEENYDQLTLDRAIEIAASRESGLKRINKT